MKVTVRDIALWVAVGLSVVVIGWTIFVLLLGVGALVAGLYPWPSWLVTPPGSSYVQGAVALFTVVALCFIIVPRLTKVRAYYITAFVLAFGTTVVGLEWFGGGGGSVLQSPLWMFSLPGQVLVSVVVLVTAVLLCRRLLISMGRAEADMQMLRGMESASRLEEARQELTEARKCRNMARKALEYVETTMPATTVLSDRSASGYNEMFLHAMSAGAKSAGMGAMTDQREKYRMRVDKATTRAVRYPSVQTAYRALNDGEVDEKKRVYGKLVHVPLYVWDIPGDCNYGDEVGRVLHDHADDINIIYCHLDIGRMAYDASVSNRIRETKDFYKGFKQLSGQLKNLEVLSFVFPFFDEYKDAVAFPYEQFEVVTDRPAEIKRFLLQTYASVISSCREALMGIYCRRDGVKVPSVELWDKVDSHILFVWRDCRDSAAVKEHFRYEVLPLLSTREVEGSRSDLDDLYREIEKGHADYEESKSSARPGSVNGMTSTYKDEYPANDVSWKKGKKVV